jgi:hypothetical protein
VTPDRRTVGQPVFRGIAVALGRGLGDAAGVAGSVAVAGGIDAVRADGEATTEAMGVGEAARAGGEALAPGVAQAATSTPRRINRP